MTPVCAIAMAGCSDPVNLAIAKDEEMGLVVRRMAKSALLPPEDTGDLRRPQPLVEWVDEGPDHCSPHGRKHGHRT